MNASCSSRSDGSTSAWASPTSVSWSDWHVSSITRPTSAASSAECGREAKSIAVRPGLGDARTVAWITPSESMAHQTWSRLIRASRANRMNRSAWRRSERRSRSTASRRREDPGLEIVICLAWGGPAELDGVLSEAFLGPSIGLESSRSMRRTHLRACREGCWSISWPVRPKAVLGIGTACIPRTKNSAHQ